MPIISREPSVLLEYYELTGEPISVHNEREKERTSPYNFSYFVLTDDREKLYARIEDRIDEMMSQGLVDEVRQLKDMGCRKGMTSMQGLGYKDCSRILRANARWRRPSISSSGTPVILPNGS